VGGSWQTVALASRGLWLPDVRSVPDTLVYRAGVRQVTSAEVEWEADALLPAGSWREHPLSRRPGSAVAAGGFDAGRDVALVPVGDRLGSLAGSGRDLLVRFGRLDHYFGVHDDVPGRLTATVDPASGLLLGLHLDNWDRLPAGQRAGSRNRLSVNLGPEPRSFLFVDADLVTMYPPEVIPSTGGCRRLVRQLVQDATSPPTGAAPAVVRLVVPPGWGYIAPTENLLHDACSLGQRTGTRHVSGLGYFSPARDRPGV
jgi:hypothetical protein